jgi:hypothetical protein
LATRQTGIATSRCHELGQPEPPAFLLYVDQCEELYVRSDERQRRRFSDAVAAGLVEPTRRCPAYSPHRVRSGRT